MKLKVKSKKEALVCHYELLPNVLRYVGWKFKRSQGILDKSGNMSGAFERSDDVVELPYMPEYITALKCGDLIPADKETAKAAGLNIKG